MEHIYFWDIARNHGHLDPALDAKSPHAEAIWDMRWEELSRIQFKELVEAVQGKGGEMIDESDLKVVKAKILNPSSGVSFTPRKKARYSAESWEFPDVEVLGVIEEGPDPSDQEAILEHVAQQWKGAAQAIEALKSMSGKSARYEEEMDSLGADIDIDSLRSAMTRLSTLVGTPVDGIAFDLFAMVDHAEESVLDLDTIVQTSFAPRMVDLEATTAATKAALATYKASTGDVLKERLGDLESQMKAMEATSVPNALKGLVLQVHTSIKTEIFPAIRALWNLYELATEGRVDSCVLGVKSGPAQYLGSNRA
jgi:hypothetical protein